MSNTGQPPEKPTVEISAPPDWAVKLTEKVVGGFANTESRFDKTDANIELVATDLKNTKEDLRVTKESIALKFLELERSQPLTSERAHAIVVEHTSQVDMEAQAREAAQIVKDAERDRQIAETRALAEKAATKDDVKLLAEGTATKAEVTALLETATAAQTTTIDGRLSDQDGKLDAILTIAKTTAAALGSKRLRYFLLVCAALGAMGGGAVAGWNAHEVSKALPAAHP